MMNAKNLPACCSEVYVDFHDPQMVSALGVFAQGMGTEGLSSYVVDTYLALEAAGTLERKT